MDYLEPILKDGTLFIDNSTLQHFCQCPRSFFYYKIRKRESGGPKAALNFGANVHVTLGMHYDERPDDEITAVTQKLFLEADIPLDDYRNVGLAMNLLGKYREHYATEAVDVLEEDGMRIIERPFAIPLGTVDGVPIVWTGRIDLVGTVNGHFVIVDHKTSSRFGSTFFDAFRNDQAQLGYTWAVREHLRRRGVDPNALKGFMINALIVRKPSRTGVPFDFHREIFPVTEDRIEEWKANTMEMLAMLIGCIRRGTFPMTTKSCIGMYGPCQYLSTCQLAKDRRDAMLNTGFYQDVTWNPLEDDKPAIGLQPANA